MFRTNYLLKGKRVANNKSQSDMAQYLGKKNKSAYSMKENGKRGFTDKEIEKIAILFKLSPMELVEIFLPELYTQIEQK